jgi:hypothetical protein
MSGHLIKEETPFAGPLKRLTPYSSNRNATEKIRIFLAECFGLYPSLRLITLPTNDY